MENPFVPVPLVPLCFQPWTIMSLLTVEAFKVHFTPLESQLNIGQQQPFFPSAFVALLVIHSGDSFCQLVFLMVFWFTYTVEQLQCCFPHLTPVLLIMGVEHAVVKGGEYNLFRLAFNLGLAADLIRDYRHRYSQYHKAGE